MMPVIVYHAIFIRGRIHMETPFHVGSGQSSTLTDMAILRDQSGRPFIPGSTLAGLIRSQAVELAPHIFLAETGPGDALEIIDSLFGWTPTRNEDERFGVASRLFVENGWLIEQTSEYQEIRDHVGINRRRGAAQPRLKFDREVVPAGSDFTFEIMIENARADDLCLLLPILDFWQQEGIQIGGRTTTGLGQAKLKDIVYYGLDFSDHAILTGYLRPPMVEDAPSIWFDPLPSASLRTRDQLQEEVSCEVDHNSSQAEETQPEDTGGQVQPEFLLPQHLYVDIGLEFCEPVLVAGSIPDLSAEPPSDSTFFKTILLDGQEIYCLPGSSLRGVLRTRAEKIVRTLNYYKSYKAPKAARADACAEDRYRQILSACAITHYEEETDWERMAACFGTSEKQQAAQSEGVDPKDIYTYSCPVCRLFGNSMMRSRLTVGEGYPLSEFAEGGLQGKLFDHVAIDRFTGGAADAKKFDSRPVLPDLDGRPLFGFRLHLDRFEPWMLGLLGLVLKDLTDSDMRFGHATHRGYGKVRGHISNIRVYCLSDSDFIGLCNESGLAFQDSSVPYKVVDLTQMLVESSAAAALFKKCHAQLISLVNDLARPDVSLGRLPE